MAKTSARLIELSGCCSLAITTTVLPLTIAGATTLTRPRSDAPLPWGATIATTPVGSGTERLKYGPATGLPVPATCTYLSAQPANYTQESIAASTCAVATDFDTPSEAEISAMNCSRRPSSTSAMRYST